MSIRRAGTARTIGPARTINTALYPALQAAQLADSPLGLWPLQETSGSVAADESGNGRDGTYTGGTLGAAAIDGVGLSSYTTGRVTIAYGSWMNTDSWTCEILVSSTNGANYKSPMGRNGVAAHGILWTWQAGGATNSFYGNAGTPTVSPDTATGVGTGTPYLLAAKWDKGAGTCSIWLDGVSIASASNSGASADKPVDSPLYLGDCTPGSYPWAGSIAYAAYYGTALSDARLLAHAQAVGPA